MSPGDEPNSGEKKFRARPFRGTGIRRCSILWQDTDGYMLLTKQAFLH